MTEKPASVRIASPEDEAEIWGLMQEAYKEQPIMPLVKERVMEKVMMGTRRKGGVIGVIDGKDGLEGYLIAVLSRWWYTDEWHVEELSNFVHPDHRKSQHAKNLIEFAKWFAEQMNLPLIMGIMSTKRLDAKVRLYKRQVTQCGAVFLHNTPHAGLLSEMG
jgi:GNAT superfamily N-acetyltransferase